MKEAALSAASAGPAVSSAAKQTVAAAAASDTAVVQRPKEGWKREGRNLKEVT